MRTSGQGRARERANRAAIVRRAAIIRRSPSALARCGHHRARHRNQLPQLLKRLETFTPSRHVTRASVTAMISDRRSDRAGRPHSGPPRRATRHRAGARQRTSGGEAQADAASDTRQRRQDGGKTSGNSALVKECPNGAERIARSPVHRLAQ